MGNLLNEHGEFERADEPKLMKLRKGPPENMYVVKRWRRTCRVCQRNFWAETEREKYCSLGCERIALERQHSLDDGRRCPVCGKPVTGNPLRVYCSEKCKRRSKA